METTSSYRTTGQQIEIAMRDDIRVDQIAELPGAIRSAHIGNHYPSNLALLEMMSSTQAKDGLRFVLYDRTVKDQNYHPHTLIFNGKSHQIGDPTIMTAHSRVTKEVPHEFSHMFESGSSLVDGHNMMLGLAFSPLPSGSIETYTKYLVRNAEIVERIIKYLNPQTQNLWDRVVHENGRIKDRKGSLNFQQIIDSGVFGLPGIGGRSAELGGDEGLLIPNDLNVFIFAVVEAITRDTNEVWHVSGPDMVRYVGKMSGLLDKMYRVFADEMRRREDVNLSPKLRFNLVPSATALRLAVPLGDANSLDELIRAYDFYQRSLSNSRFDFSASAAEATRAARREFDMHTVRNSKMFYNLAAGTFTSQYDILLAGNQQASLYIPKFVQNSKIADAASMFGMMEAAYQRIQQEDYR
jgi:hypothetical protein